MTQILVFGPSTTYGAWDLEGGWVQRLRKFLDKKVIDSNYEEYFLVYNLGIDGDNSEGLLKRFESEAKPRMWPEEETIILINIGVNDTIFNNKTKKLKISPEQFERNITQIFEKAKSFTEKVIFVGNKPIDQSKVDPIPWLQGFSYKEEYIEQFDKIIKKVCDQKKVKFLEVKKEFVNGDYKKLLADGIHPTSEGHKRIFEIVRDFLVKEKLI